MVLLTLASSLIASVRSRAAERGTSEDDLVAAVLEAYLGRARDEGPGNVQGAQDEK